MSPDVSTVSQTYVCISFLRGPSHQALCIETKISVWSMVFWTFMWWNTICWICYRLLVCKKRHVWKYSQIALPLIILIGINTVVSFVIYQQSFALHINGNKPSGSGSNNILQPDSLRQLNTKTYIIQKCIFWFLSQVPLMYSHSF